jgi:hypothetical protein
MQDLQNQIDDLNATICRLASALVKTTHANDEEVKHILRLALDKGDEPIYEEPTRQEIEAYNAAEIEEEIRKRDAEKAAEIEAEVRKAVEQPTYTLDDVRAKVTEVMKADKTKKGALQALLKAHGADRVSELKEEHFAAVIDAIEKGDF